MTFSATELLLILVIVPVVVLLAWALVDLARHDALPVVRKLVWLAAILLLPLVGPLVYLVFRPPRQADIRGIGRGRPRSQRAQELLGGDRTVSPAGEGSPDEAGEGGVSS